VRALAERSWTGHALAILALAALHVMVFARSLFREGGWPSVHIPWDFVDSYHRFLVFIGDAFQARTLPLWYPYGEAGIPFFLNPQNQLWSPVTWLVGGLFGYDMVTAQRQIIWTLLAGGVGCYVLAASLWHSRSAALFAALAYNFSAARIAHCEHLDVVNAFSLLPWLLWALRRLAQERRGATVLLAFVAYLFLVSGYPGVVLLSPLWLGGWAVVLGWDMDARQRKRFLRGLGGAVLLALALGAGYWLPQLVFRSAFARGEPLTTQQALAQAMSFKDLAHLIFGVGLDVVSDGGNIDVSMRGLYFGIVAIPLVAAALVFRRDRLTAALAWGSLFALLMALGGSFFVRTAMHVLIHGLNLSRFPSLDARAVAILGGALLAGAGLELLLRRPADGNGPPAVSLPGAATGSLEVFLGRAFLALLVVLGAGLVVLRWTIFQSVTPVMFSDRVAGPVMAEILWLLVALVAYRRLGPSPRLARALIVLAALDVGSQVHLNYLVVGHDAPVTWWQALDNEHTATFDVAKARITRSALPSLKDVRTNLGYTTKSFFVGTYGPFELRRFSDLIAAGFIDFVTNGAKVVAFAGPVPDAGPAFAAGAIPVDYAIDSYLPDQVTYTINLPAQRTLVFNEVYFPGWKGSIDGGPFVPMREVAHGLRAMDAPAGRHQVVARFSPRTFWVGAAISLGGWLICIGCLLAPALRRRRLGRAA